MKSTRNKESKYFKKVGFVGSTSKSIPHWATDDHELLKIKIWQQKNKNSDDIFGKLNPLKVTYKLHFNKMFGFASSRNFTSRGSSEIWKDNSEFDASVHITQQVNKSNKFSG